MTVFKYGIPFETVRDSVRYVQAILTLPPYLRDLKINLDRDAAQRSAERTAEWEEFKSDLPAKEAFSVVRRSGILSYPDIDLEGWK